MFEKERLTIFCGNPMFLLIGKFVLFAKENGLTLVCINPFL